MLIFPDFQLSDVRTFLLDVLQTLCGFPLIYCFFVTGRFKDEEDMCCLKREMNSKYADELCIHGNICQFLLLGLWNIKEFSFK